MEPEQHIDTKESAWKSLTTVTSLSKSLAMILFIILPFVGGWVGYMLALEIREGVVFEKDLIKEREIVKGLDEVQGGIGNTVFIGEELGISFSYPSDWDIEKHEACGYRLLKSIHGAFLSAYSASEVLTCSDAIGTSWHVMASGVTENYLFQCEADDVCSVLTNDHGVFITKELGYVHPVYGPGVCDEEGRTLNFVDELTGLVCRENAVYRVYQAGGSFSGFVMNTAPLNPESDQSQNIIEEFEKIVVKSFKFFE